MKKLSNQRRWQKERVSRGLCMICSAPRTHYALRCDPCQVKQREINRRSEGSDPWTGHGRKPIVAE